MFVPIGSVLEPGPFPPWRLPVFLMVKISLLVPLVPGVLGLFSLIDDLIDIVDLGFHSHQGCDFP